MTRSPALGVAASSLAPLALPRARALTDLVLGTACEATTDPVADDGARSVGRRTEEGLVRLVGRRRSGQAQRCVRVGTYQVCTALAGPLPQPGQPPFRWTARSARRAVGLAAVRTLLEGDATSPAEAAAAVVSDPARIAAAGSSADPCAAWVGALGAPARAIVEAEAATWASQVWTALEWHRLAETVVGAPDRWWSWPGSVRVAVRGRADLRVGPATGGGAHLLVLPGSPSAATRLALCLSALVDLLLRGPAAIPARVVGWWPECGKAWAVSPGPAALDAVGGAVLRAVDDALARGPERR